MENAKKSSKKEKEVKDRSVKRDMRNRSKSKSIEKTVKRNRSRSRDNSRKDTERKRSRSKDRSEKKDSKQIKSKRTPSDSSSSDSSSEDENPEPTKKWGLVTADGKQIKISKSAYEKNETTSKQTKTTWVRPERKQLNDDEMDKKRREMMTNAQWRDKERESNVKKYREEDMTQTDKDGNSSFDHDFITKQLTKAARTETVESRIKSKINTIQRSGRAMDSNFARR